MKYTILFFTVYLIFCSFFSPSNTYVALESTSESTLYCAMRKRNNNYNNVSHNADRRGSDSTQEEFNEKITEQLVRIEKDIKELKNDQTKNRNSDRAQRFFTGLVFGILILVLILIFYMKRRITARRKKNNSKNNNNYKTTHLNGDIQSNIRGNVGKLEKELNVTYNAINVLKIKVENLERDVSGLQEGMKKSTDEILVKQTTTSNELNDADNRNNSQNKTKYLKGKTGDKFKREVDSKDEDTFYSLEKSGNIGSFKFCGNQENAIGNFNAVFDNICEYEGDPTRATKINHVESGQVELIDGCWVVTKKAKIKVE